ncbi:uncharacterized protein LOC143196725 [Rhynchophorus ferrugineus]|uniref:uncharacterized protein LOC143196725 n=1 Tax=Rhynchophorus ferrugineus TaxID=354439 RepID=UPI003FCD03DA
MGIGGGLGLNGAGLGMGIGEAGLGVGGAGLGLGGAGVGMGGAGLIGGAGLGVGGGMGYGGVGAGLGYGGIGGGQLIGAGGIGGGIGAGGLGLGGGYAGSAMGQNQYSGGHANENNANFHKAGGNQGNEFNNAAAGYSNGNTGLIDSQGQKGYYNSLAGGKNLLEDGKHYAGGQNFNQKGVNGDEYKEQQGHKKGHRVKGFKTSHHKDESGKTEEFYDEAHDEGNNLAFKGQSGSFGNQATSAFQGAQENGKYNQAEQGKAGHLNNQYIVNAQKGEAGKYGQNKHGTEGSVYGLNKGIDAQSLLGHQENSKFYKYNSVPFYHH